MGPLLTSELHKAVIDSFFLEQIPCLILWGEAKGYSKTLGHLLSVHVTVYTGEGLIGSTNEANQSDHEIARNKRHDQEHPGLSDWHKDK